jgi:glycosyltransferase involved in cell wall biosynthesis
VTRRARFIERRTLEWYKRNGLRLLLTPNAMQASLFPGPVVVDLDDPARIPEEQAVLRTPNIRHVIVTTESTARYVSSSNPGVAVTVIPQGVDVERASRARCEELRAKILSDCGLRSDTVIVGHHAPVICLSDDDGSSSATFRTFYADVLISAVRKLWAEGLSFVTVLVGKTSRTIDELARSERRLVLAGYVERDHLFDWVSAFDIGTYPRTVDFSGRQSVKLLEYMANGAAIVAMRTCETEFLEETSAGLAAGDPDEFCRRLRLLISDRDERDVLVKRGKALAANYDWRKLAAHYDRILAAVAKTA